MERMKGFGPSSQAGDSTEAMGRAKPPFIAVGHAEKISRQQPREEFLNQILGILSGVAFSANISVKRIPVSAAQRLQSRLCPRRRGVPRGQNHTPVCGREDTGLRLRW